MDLGAFLQSGKEYPVVLTVEGESRYAGLPPKTRGKLVGRSRGRYLWLSPMPYPKGWLLSLSVRLRGWQLDENGGLTPALGGTPSVVVLTLMGRVEASRSWRAGKLFVLRLTLLGRVL